MVDLKTKVERILQKTCYNCGSRCISITFGLAKCTKCGESITLVDARKLVEDYKAQNG